MTLSSTTIGLVALLIICFLLGYEFVSFDHEGIDPSPGPVKDLAPEILEEVKRVEKELLEFKSIKHPDSVARTTGASEDEIAHLLDTKFEAFQKLMEQSITEMGISKPEEMPPMPEIVMTPPPIAPQLTTSLDEHKPWKHMPLRDRTGIYGTDKCDRKEKIYFLKTSKTGSTTMANILMRFGFSRPGTNFLMGESPNGAMFFLNGYMPFNENLCYIGRDIPDRPKFDISYVHMR